MRYLVCALVSGFFAVGAAKAEDIAFVIGNQSYSAHPDLQVGQSDYEIAQTLQQNGFRVLRVRNAGFGDMNSAAQQFYRSLQTAGEVDRVVVSLSGHFVHNAQDTWLLKSNADEPTWLQPSSTGLSLHMLAGIAAEFSDRSLVILHAPEQSAELKLGYGLQSGLGPLNAPQGLSIVTGDMPALASWLEEEVFGGEQSLSASFEALPEGAQHYGYTTRLMGFGETDGKVEQPGFVGEFAYWNAVRDIGGPEALNAYLNRYPDGVYAQAARQLLSGYEVAAGNAAADEEKSLALGRRARSEIQRNLELLGHDPQGIDGIFGAATRRALRAWQRAERFDDTGYLTAVQVVQLEKDAYTRGLELEAEADKRRAEQERKDKAAWKAAQAAGTLKALRAYLNSYPDGLFVDAADQKVEALLEKERENLAANERQAWDATRAEDTREAYGRFLKAYPKSRFADTAKARQRELAEQADNRAKLKALRTVEKSILPNQDARKVVETLLDRSKLDAGKIDGKFTKKTRRAIRQFQSTRGLLVTGFVDQRTMAFLMISHSR